MIKKLTRFLSGAGKKLSAGAKKFSASPSDVLKGAGKGLQRAAPWAIGGALTSAAVGEYAKYQKNYMGDEAFNAKYKGATDIAQTGLIGLGLYHGLGAALKLEGATGLAKRAVGTAHNLLRPGAKKMKSLTPMHLLGGTAMTAGTFFTLGLPGSAYFTGAVAGLGGYSMAAKAFGHSGPLAMVGASIGMGLLASNMPRYAAGEGNITDFRQGETTPSRKMDFNTAGLVQALHHNRRA